MLLRLLSSFFPLGQIFYNRVNITFVLKTPAPIAEYPEIENIINFWAAITLLINFYWLKTGFLLNKS